MAHNIMENDRGIVGFSEVYGGTWHGLPQYKVVEGECSPDYIRSFIGYEVEKRQAMTEQEFITIDNPDGTTSELVIPAEPIEGNFYLRRKDDRSIICKSVGERFEIFPNGIFFDWIMQNIITPNKISIESAGTLKGGQIFFLNLDMKKFVVKGDNSETATKLMYRNAYGTEAVSCGCHSTRIVCNNTLMLAETQAAANGTLKKFNHTKNVHTAVQNMVVDLTATVYGIEKHVDTLNYLAGLKMDSQAVQNFLDVYIPIPKPGSPLKGITGAINKREELLTIFDTCDNLKGDIWHTKYSMLQAVTDQADHTERNKRQTADSASTWYDGLFGNKAEQKEKAYRILTAPNALQLTA